MGRYTITTRLEGAWRWAAVKVGEDDSIESIIENARNTLQVKIEEAEFAASLSPEKAEDVKLWTMGGVTLTDPDGNVLWSRPVQH